MNFYSFDLRLCNHRFLFVFVEEAEELVFEISLSFLYLGDFRDSLVSALDSGDEGGEGAQLSLQWINVIHFEICEACIWNLICFHKYSSWLFCCCEVIHSSCPGVGLLDDRDKLNCPIVELVVFVLFSEPICSATILCVAEIKLLDLFGIHVGVGLWYISMVCSIHFKLKFIDWFEQSTYWGWLIFTKEAKNNFS